jgi:hypothetical protein
MIDVERITRTVVTMLVAMALCGAACAAAQDLPLPKPQPAPRRATGCESMGEGFVKFEGLDTCVKISGAVRLDVGASTAARAGVFGAAGH